MQDPRGFATNVVGVAIAALGVALLVAAGVLVSAGSVFLGILVGVFGLVVLAAAGTFLLVPFKVDELAEDPSVRSRQR